MSKFQDRLSERINQIGVSYPELAKLSGISKSCIQRYATGGTKEIPVEKVKALADALDVDFLWLLGYADNDSDDKTRNEERLFSVYAIRCEENGKTYVGCTGDVQRRVKAHLSDLKGGRKTDVKAGKKTPSNWQKDFDKYGSCAFKVYLLESFNSKMSALNAEKKWIKYYDSENPDRGYNKPARMRNNRKEIEILPCKPPKRF